MLSGAFRTAGLFLLLAGFAEAKLIQSSEIVEQSYVFKEITYKQKKLIAILNPLGYDCVSDGYNLKFYGCDVTTQGELKPIYGILASDADSSIAADFLQQYGLYSYVESAAEIYKKLQELNVAAAGKKGQPLKFFAPPESVPSKEDPLTVVSAFVTDKLIDISKFAADYINGKEKVFYTISEKYLKDIKISSSEFRLIIRFGNPKYIKSYSYSEGAVHKTFSVRLNVELIKNAIQRLKEYAYVDRTDLLEALTKRLENNPSSYRRLFRFGQNTNLRDRIYTTECKDQLIPIYKLGRSLLVEEIYDEAVSVLEYSKSFPSGKKDALFYHWTMSDDFFKLFPPVGKRSLQGVFDEMFLFQRNRVYAYRGAGEHANLWDTVFYVAEDPESSKHVGNFGLEFELKRDAKIINVVKLNELSRNILLKYPELSVCFDLEEFSVRDQFSTVTTNPLSFLIAEESGIDIIDYNQDLHWFQVVNSDALVNAKQYGTGGGNLHDVYLDATKNKKIRDVRDVPHYSLFIAAVKAKGLSEDQLSSFKDKFALLLNGQAGGNELVLDEFLEKMISSHVSLAIEYVCQSNWDRASLRKSLHVSANDFQKKSKLMFTCDLASEMKLPGKFRF